MEMFTWWDARGRRLPWLIVIVLLLAGGYAATAEARTPTISEWKQAAERQAARECNARERRAPKVGEGPFQIPTYICNQFSAAAERDPCARNLANDVAHCWATFTMDYWTKGKTRHFHGYIPMYLGRPRPRDRHPRIGVGGPILWLTWWSGSQPT